MWQNALIVSFGPLETGRTNQWLVFPSPHLTQNSIISTLFHEGGTNGYNFSYRKSTQQRKILIISLKKRPNSGVTHSNSIEIELGRD